MRIAFSQINPTVGDFPGNTQKIKDYIKLAEDHSVDCIIFPELAVCGYPPQDLLLKKHFVEKNISVLHDIAGSVADCAVIIGFVDVDHASNDNLFNAAAFIHKGKIQGIYHKKLLPNYAVFDEKRYFVPGMDNYIFIYKGIKIGITICEDIWQQSGPYADQASGGAKILVNISASPFYAGKNKARQSMLIERAKSSNAFLCFVNLIGGQDELVFDGSSCLITPGGKIAAESTRFAEDFTLFDLDIEPQETVPVEKDSTCKEIFVSAAGESEPEKPALPQRKIIPTQTKIIAPQIKNNPPQTGSNPHPQLNILEEINNALILGTGDYVRKNGFQKVLIGLSGGIDSALTAVIAVDALGSENVVGVSMPCRYSSSETKQDAQKLAENLGIRFMEISIENIFKVYLAELADIFKDTAVDVTEENLQARIRGNILMALSNKFNWLVLTTGNKSETAVGYSTLYGDLAGGFAVIKDVPKTVVYEIVNLINQRADRELIPRSIIQRAPSAELREDQKDEDSLPPYPILDSILKAYIEDRKSPEEIQSQEEISPEILHSIIPLVNRSEYKRRQSPPGIRITALAFGRDRRMPITHKFREFPN